MNSPYFSIVIPTLNEEKCITYLLEDLVKQEDRDFEVIVADGDSEDRTQRLVNDFKAPYRLRVLVNRHHYVSFQRNAGAKLAQGIYLVFLDADVRLLPTYLKLLHQQLINEDVDYASVRTAHNIKHPFEYLLAYPIACGRFISLLLGRPYFSGENIIMKRLLLTKLGGFDEGFALGEDVELVHRAAANGYRGKFFFQPVVKGSVRRFAKEGRVKILWHYTRVFFHFLLFGRRLKLHQAYKMGG